MVKKILFAAAALSILVNIILFIYVGSLRRDNVRYKANQAALLNNIERYKTESGKNAATVEKLTLSYGELRKNYDNICKTADDLRIKVKRLQSVSTTGLYTEVNLQTEVKDSVIYRNSVPDSLLSFKWKDPWIDIDGDIRGRKIDLTVSVTDTIMQIVHRVPHKWWFIKWGTKAIRQEMVSTNPHTKITYTNYIELK